MSGRSRTLSTFGVAGDPVDIRTACHLLTLYPEPGPLFETFERLIGTASRRVWLETYIYRDDALGGPFADLLASAAKRGLDVRLLYDPQGSQETRRSFFDHLAARGVLVRAYRPWRLAPKRWMYWPRDHGRILIIDDVAHTGGINWGMEWLPRAKGGEEWHDVSLGVRGAAVKDFAFVFSCRWAEASERDEIADYAGSDEADDDWATVGTFNAMSPGVWWANETNVIVQDRGFVLQLARVFERDRAESVPVTPGWLARRPRLTRLWERFVGMAYRLLESLIREAARQRKARRSKVAR